MHKVLVVSLFVFSVLRTTHGVDVYWRDYDGTIPSDALQTGHNVYIAQLTYNNASLTGSFYPESKQAISLISGRKIVQTSNFKIMCSTDFAMMCSTRFRWENVTTAELKGAYLDKCVKGGFEADNLYIGKLFHQNEWKIGKVFSAASRWKGLNLWRSDTNGAFSVHNFEILRAD